jgi:ribosome-binding factor A
MSRSQSDKSVRRLGVPSQRQLRVGELLRKALVETLERVELRDPDIAGIPITVSEVAVSADLKAATIYVMPLGGEKRDAVIAGLARAAPFLRGQIARRVELRHVPRLMFRIDTAFDASAHINQLLHAVLPADKPVSDDDTEDDFGPEDDTRGSDDGA